MLGQLKLGTILTEVKNERRFFYVVLDGQHLLCTSGQILGPASAIVDEANYRLRCGELTVIEVK